MAQIKIGRWVTAATEGVSSGLRLDTETLVGLYTPSALDAAQLKLQASQEGQSYFDIVEDGQPVTVSAAADAYIPLDATQLLGAAYVRVAHLDAQGGAVVESAERVLLPVYRAFE